MDPGAAAGTALCSLVCVLGVGCLIGAVILRAACTLYNKLAGGSPPSAPSRPFYPEDAGNLGRSYGTGIQEGTSPARMTDDFDYPRDPDYDFRGTSGVPEPTFGKAFGIVLVAQVTNMLVGFVVGLVLGAAGVAAGGAPGFGRPGAAALEGMNLIVQLAMIPIGLLIQAGLVSAMLPTSFGKAMLLTLLYLAIGIAVALVIGAIVLAFIFAFGMARF